MHHIVCWWPHTTKTLHAHWMHHMLLLHRCGVASCADRVFSSVKGLKMIAFWRCFESDTMGFRGLEKCQSVGSDVSDLEGTYQCNGPSSTLLEGKVDVITSSVYQAGLFQSALLATA